MSLAAGQRLGPYEILAPLGAGGMGEVYKARDTRLERTVAIKILREPLAGSPERRERFEREAKALSRLNHAHISTLHDIGSEDGIDFLVMEHVSGENLADRLMKKPFPARQALAYGIQIADALDAAHRLGIVHRDLKPGNIMVTEAGIKLLDFGLARLVAPESEDSGKSESVLTRQKPLTSEGAILGTFQYMAPEQLEGKAADFRTDLFALGVVVYEMLTGRKAFSGKSQASLIAAILEHEPEPMSKLAPLTPRSLERIVTRCLAKDPAARWASAHEVRELLSFVAEEEGIVSGASAAPRAEWRRFLPWAIAALGIATAVLAFLWVEAPAPQPLIHFEIVPPEEASFRPTDWWRDLAISPNGEYLVYAVDFPARLFVRRLGDSAITTLVPEAEYPVDPFFSPDGEWVGYQETGRWRKVSVRGGPAATLWSTNQDARGASWGPNGAIVLATVERDTGLLLLPAGGGEPEVLTRPDDSKGESDHWWPEFLPDGRAILFDIVSDQNESRVAVLSLATGNQKVLVPSGSNARYVDAGETGYILFAAERALWAVEFDRKRLEILGNPFPVLENLNQKQDNAANYGVSRNGTLVYNVNTGIEETNVLAWVDRKGAIAPLPLPPARYDAPSLSPDGRRLALHVFKGLGIYEGTSADIWIYDVERGAFGRRTFEGVNWGPIWSPDGEEILYGGGPHWPNVRLMRLRADGASQGEEIGVDIESKYFQIPTSWSDRHRTLLYQYGDQTWKFSLEEEKAEPFLALEGAILREARFSPDETHVAYRSDETGRDEIYVVPFPGPGGEWQISTEGGAQPMWAPKGGELFYKNGNRMMAVEVRTSPSFHAGAPRVLFEIALPESTPGDPSRYGVAPDGRFLVVAPAPVVEEGDEPDIHVIVNWAETLRDKR